MATDNNKPTIYIAAEAGRHGVPNPEFSDAQYYPLVGDMTDGIWSLIDEEFGLGDRGDNGPEFMREYFLGVLDRFGDQITPDVLEVLRSDMLLSEGSSQIYYSTENIMKKIVPLGLESNDDPILGRLSNAFDVPKSKMRAFYSNALFEGESHKARRFYEAAGYNVVTKSVYGQDSMEDFLEHASKNPNDKVIFMAHLGNPVAENIFGINDYEWDDIKNRLDDRGFTFTNDIFMASCGAGSCDVNYGEYADEIFEDMDKEEVRTFVYNYLNREFRDIIGLSEGEDDWEYLNFENLAYDLQSLEEVTGAKPGYNWREVFGPLMDFTVEHKKSNISGKPYLSLNTDKVGDFDPSVIQNLQRNFDVTIYATPGSWHTTLPTSGEVGSEYETIEDEIAAMLYSNELKGSTTAVSDIEDLMNVETGGGSYFGVPLEPSYRENLLNVFQPGESTGMMAELAALLGVEDISPESLMQFYQDYPADNKMYEVDMRDVLYDTGINFLKSLNIPE